MIDILIKILQDFFFSALAAVGFAILFNVPRRTLGGVALAGALGHGLRTILVMTGSVSLVSASFAGACAVGLVGEILYKKHQAPTSIFTVSGIIPMVPGTFAYKCMISLLSATESGANSGLLIQQGAVNGLQAGLILAAISVGITFPRLL